MSGVSLIGQIHFLLGALCLLAGMAAFVLTKGARGQVLAGRVFAASMLLLCASGLYMSFARSIVFTTFLSLFAAHAAATGWLAAREKSGKMGRSERALAALITLVGLASLATGYGLSASDLDQLDGLAPGAFYALGGVALFIAALDGIALSRSPLSRRQRIARHLWRMGFSMFIATFIFFFGNNHVLPEALRTEAVLVIPVALVALLTLFWLLRVVLSGRRKR